MRVFLLLVLIAVASAFAPHRPVAHRVSSMQSLKMGSADPGPTYWESDAPPSSVLGVGEKVPSGNYTVMNTRLLYYPKNVTTYLC